MKAEEDRQKRMIAIATSREKFENERKELVRQNVIANSVDI